MPMFQMTLNAQDQLSVIAMPTASDLRVSVVNFITCD